MGPFSQEKLHMTLLALEEQLRLSGSTPIGIVVCGGSALIAMHLVSRTTKDVDVVALQHIPGELTSANPLPDSLLIAAKIVSNALHLPEDWINAGPAELFSMGLPEGFASRLTEQVVGPVLTVYYIGRIDQIHFKLYASVDRGGYHISDLMALSPSEAELEQAARWTITHDVSEGYRAMLQQLLAELGFHAVAERV